MVTCKNRMTYFVINYNICHIAQNTISTCIVNRKFSIMNMCGEFTKLIFWHFNCNIRFKVLLILIYWEINMDIEQIIYSDKSGWEGNEKGLGDSADLVYVFGARELLIKESNLQYLYDLYPKAKFIGCSTSGEINCETVLDNTIVATAVRF